ncbi:hypothetical protein GCM10010360_18600 [Streptomyces nogalater]
MVEREPRTDGIGVGYEWAWRPPSVAAATAGARQEPFASGGSPGGGVRYSATAFRGETKDAQKVGSDDAVAPARSDDRARELSGSGKGVRGRPPEAERAAGGLDVGGGGQGKEFGPAEALSRKRCHYSCHSSRILCRNDMAKLLPCARPMSSRVVLYEHKNRETVPP